MLSLWQLLKKTSSVSFAGPPFLGHQMGKFCPKKGAIQQWVLIKAFPMISTVPKGVIGSKVI
jgi:hypothetical protein